MKLTKGKIAKLYNKRKQTLKKKGKPKRGASKSKTFRQNRKINLSRRSLKRFSYLGGRLPPSALDRGLRVVDAGLSGANARLSDAEELAYRVPPVVPGAVEAQAGVYAAREGVTMAQEGLSAAQTELSQPELPVVEQPELTEQMASTIDPELPMVEQPELPVVEQPELPIVEQPELPMVEQPELPMVEQPELPMVEQPELPMVEQPELPQEVTPSEEQKNKLTDAIKTIVDEIAKQVESNLTDGSPQENSFDALAGAVGKMGGKRRNTRRFKLVKNKTKRAAA
jgi:hypothetical protein